VAGHIFQARPVWIYTQSNITNIILIILIILISISLAHAVSNILIRIPPH
jgi:hypothetical protein